jgi:hypothetical protein
MNPHNFFSELKRRNWRAHATPRADCGALAATYFRKTTYVEDAETKLGMPEASSVRAGLANCTRGRVRSPQSNRRVGRQEMSNRNFFSELERRNVY